ncbi:MAG: hypothetical protein DI628_02040 [Blastochloris viridis]|uniref:Uncharacterized protein n=1 Tax=Blastochloris viridis TaxID=1079 RepID=A0A6N4RBM3_BLAVI|nr:MAG: hypothetical protein DI628_02040 [Blastochloris viridis]
MDNKPLTFREFINVPTLLFPALFAPFVFAFLFAGMMALLSMESGQSSPVDTFLGFVFFIAFVWIIAFPISLLCQLIIGLPLHQILSRKNAQAWVYTISGFCIGLVLGLLTAHIFFAIGFAVTGGTQAFLTHMFTYRNHRSA